MHHHKLWRSIRHNALSWNYLCCFFADLSIMLGFPFSIFSIAYYLLIVCTAIPNYCFMLQRCVDASFVFCLMVGSSSDWQVSGASNLGNLGILPWVHTDALLTWQLASNVRTRYLFTWGDNFSIFLTNLHTYCGAWLTASCLTNTRKTNTCTPN